MIKRILANLAAANFCYGSITGSFLKSKLYFRETGSSLKNSKMKDES
jgi:hypothetical protein